MPSPLQPQVTGSIGMPHRGVLVGGTALAERGVGFRRLRQDDRRFGLPRFVDAIERAANQVADARPGGVLAIADLSSRHGGQLLPHLSHRSGRDADLLFYLTTLDGAPIASPGFIHVGPDGLAWDDESKRFFRFDVEREWLLVKSLVEDPQARIQWIFVSRNVEALLVEWARARGDDPETILRAMEVMLQPQPGGVHDDHIHIRTACTPDEIASGCEHTGPQRAWLDVGEVTDPTPTRELVEAIMRPLGGVSRDHVGVRAPSAEAPLTTRDDG